MSKKRDFPIETYKTIKILKRSLAKKLEEYRLRIAALKAGYPVLTDWHADIPAGWGDFPKVPFKSSTIYRGNAQSWGYSHHQAITKFGDMYVASWSNGLRDEDCAGQEIHLSHSTDGMNWSEPQVVVHTAPESNLVRNNAGIYAANGRLYCYVGVTEDRNHSAGSASMNKLCGSSVRLDVYETSDLKSWSHHEEVLSDIYLFEGPRRTLSGKLLCCGFVTTEPDGKVLIWDDPSELAASPRVVSIPTSSDGPRPEQGTWYQTDDGRIWMYNRDRTMSGRLALSVSDDEGETWSPLLQTDFPNTYSRAYAGCLNDGRFYICGNNYDRLLDREHLLIALSDDGYVFNRQYVLVEGNTTRRVNGQHKENGYHYPNCCPDADRLFVIYSVNKEDIEVGILDTTKID